MTIGVRALRRRDGAVLDEKAAVASAALDAAREDALEWIGVEPSRKPAHLARVVVPLTLLVIGLLLGAVWYVWTSHRAIDHLKSVEVPLAALGNEIAYQAATMRLAVEAATATGDASWEARYAAGAKRLDRALARTREIVPELFPPAPRTGPLAIEDALRARDRRLFALLRAGKGAEAARLAAGNEYRALRDAGTASVAALVDDLESRARAALHLDPGWASRDAAVVAAAAAVLLAAWFVILRLLGQVSNEARSAAESGRRERAFAEALADNARALVVVFDPEGRILRVNPSFSALTGHRMSEIRGRRWTEIFGPRGAGASGVGPDIAAGERHGAVAPIATRDGGPRAIAWHDRILRDESGTPLALVAVGEDVTDARHAERERRARAKAEHANRAKSRFLAAASHDLRQPLQAARLFIAALRNRTDDGASREIVDHVDDAVAAAESLLNALLDLSRLDAGALEPEIIDMPISPILRRLGISFGAQADAKGIALRVVDCSVYLRSDPVLLEDILRNLIANAVRYTTRGRILIGCRRRGAKLRIEVWDTGEGIPEDQRAAIFEEFRQLGRPERDQTRGLGLGLAIVDRISRLLGHRVDVASTPGKGSVFAVEVALADKPARARPPAAASKTADAPADLAGHAVLVVEDGPRQRAGLALLFDDWGCRTEAAATIEDALAHLEAGFEPDLVVTDFHLRDGAGGIAAIAALRRRLGRGVPALIVTGDTEPGRRRVMRDHDLAVLYKPVDARRLRQAAAAALKAAPSA